jgi:glycosyltransferase involved in cell wall biosynthesis
MLELLYVIDSLGAGGAERSLAALAPQYRDLGVKLDVVVLSDRPGLQQEVREAGAQVFSVAGSGGRASRVRRLSDLIRERQPDLVHTTLFEADVTGRPAARIARVPVVSSLVNEAYGPEHAAEAAVRLTRLRAAHALDALTARLTVRLHAVSEQVAQVMAARLRYPRDRVSVVGRGRDPRALGRRTPQRRLAARVALGVSDDDIVVLAVGRHEPQKALPFLVEVMSRVRTHAPRARLFVAGRSGATTDAIRDAVRARDADTWVTLLGERSDVPDLLCGADVFVLPSRREGMPGAVIEAMALEVPIVASDLAQVREVVDTDAALLAPVDRADQFARAIIECTEGVDRAQERVSIAYRRFLDRFTTDGTARQMIAFYEQALSEPHGRWHTRPTAMVLTGRGSGGEDQSETT